MLHLVRALANSPIWIALCGLGVIVVPILGIHFVHEQEKRKGGYPP